MKGRILVDVPQTGHQAGEYADIAKDTATALIQIGAFDPAAPWPDDQAAAAPEKPARRARKPEAPAADPAAQA